MSQFSRANFANQFPFLLGFVIVVLFFALPIVGFDMSYFPGDLGDGRFNNYILEHAHQFFIGKEAFWEAPFMYPEPNIITYSDNLVGSAPFYSVFRLLGGDRETSYQLWVVLMFILNYSSAYLFLNWQFKNKYAAVVGALVFSCSMAIQSQMTHAQTFPRFPIPLAFWMAMLFMKELKPVYLFGTILMIVFQFYCAIYLGFFLVVPIIALLLLALIFNRQKLMGLITNIKWLSYSVGGGVLNVLFLLPLMFPYYLRSKEGGLNDYVSIINTLPTVRSFFYSKNGSLLWDKLSQVGSDYPAAYDHQIFPGGIVMLSFVVFSFLILRNVLNKKKFRKNTIQLSTKVLFISAAITFLFFIRYQGLSFYTILFELPGFGSLRSLTRIVNLELLFFAIATTYVLTFVFDKYKKRTLPLFLVVILLFIVDNHFSGENSYRTEKGSAQHRVNVLIEKMRNIPEGSVVSYEPEFDGGSTFYQIDAMLAGQSLGLKMINGYSAKSPPGYYTFWSEMTEESRKNWAIINNLKNEEIFVIH